MTQVESLSPHKQIIENVPDVPGRIFLLLILNVIFSLGEGYDGIVAHFESLVIMNGGQVRHPCHEVLRCVELLLHCIEDKYHPYSAEFSYQSLFPHFG
jgi:hypothetical protein